MPGFPFLCSIRCHHNSERKCGYSRAGTIANSQPRPNRAPGDHQAIQNPRREFATGFPRLPLSIATILKAWAYFEALPRPEQVSHDSPKQTKDPSIASDDAPILSQRDAIFGNDRPAGRRIIARLAAETFIRNARLKGTSNNAVLCGVILGLRGSAAISRRSGSDPAPFDPPNAPLRGDSVGLRAHATAIRSSVTRRRML